MLQPPPVVKQRTDLTCCSYPLASRLAEIATAPNTGPGESQLNPGGVAPPTDNVPNPSPPKQEGSSIFQSIENPYALQEAINKLESSLDEVIHLFQGERETLASDGGFDKGKEG